MGIKLVRISYLDTSAAMKLVLDDPQSETLTAELTGPDDRRLISSGLLHTEMHCAAGRHRELAERASAAGLPVLSPGPSS